eukprot:1306425-Prymnesium_polylepis.1
MWGCEGRPHRATRGWGSSGNQVVIKWQSSGALTERREGGAAELELRQFVAAAEGERFEARRREADRGEPRAPRQIE